MPEHGILHIRRQPPAPLVEQGWREDVTALGASHGPNSVLVIAPTGTARLGVHDILSAALAEPCFLPRVEALDVLVARIISMSFAVKPLSRAAHRALVAHVLADSCERHHLRALSTGHAFPGVVRAVDRLFRALGRHKIWDPALFRAALGRYRRGETHPRDIDLVRVYEEYRRLVPDPRKGGPDPFVTETEQIARLLQEPALAEPELNRVERIVWFGFADFSPLHADLVAALAQRVPSEVVVPAPVADGVEEPPPHRTEVAVRAAADRARLRTKNTTEPGGGRTAHVTWTERDDAFDEVRWIAGQLRRELDEGRSPRQLAVAFGNLDASLPAVREVFPRYGIPFHAERGVPLTSVPPIARALGFVQLVVGRYRRVDVEELARSGGFGRRVRDALDLDVAARLVKLTGGGRTTPSRWRTALAEALRRADEAVDGESESWLRRERDCLTRAVRAADGLFELIDPLERAMTTDISASEFRARLLEVMNETDLFAEPPRAAMTAHARAAAQRDARALHLFITTLDEFADVFSALGHPTARLPEWLARWQSAIADLWVSPMEETARGISVVTVPDLRFSSAATVYIGDLSEGSFPRRPYRDLFVPAVADRERNFVEVPDVAADDLDALERERSSRTHLHLSAAKRNRGVDQLGAAVVHTLAVTRGWEPNDAVEADPPPEAKITQAALRVGRREVSIDDAWAPLLGDPSTAARARAAIHGLRVAESRLTLAADPWSGFVTLPDAVRDAWASGGDRVFSASALEKYANCGYQWFADRMLHLNEVEAFDEDVTAQERGKLAHAIVEIFHRRLGTEGRFDLSRARRLLLAAADEVLSIFPPDTLLGQARRAHFVAGLTPGDDDAVGGSRVGMLARFLEIERERAASGWTVADVEWRFGDEGGVRLDTPHGAVRVNGRVDRLDVHPDHGVVVFDYKTGNLPPHNDETRGRQFQLPLYIEAGRASHPRLGDRPWDAAYYALKVKKDKPFGPQSGIGAEHSSEDTRDRVGRVMAAVVRGSYPLTIADEIDKPPCKYCSFVDLCRVRETRLAPRRRAFAGWGDRVYQASSNPDPPPNGRTT